MKKAEIFRISEIISGNLDHFLGIILLVNPYQPHTLPN